MTRSPARSSPQEFDDNRLTLPRGGSPNGMEDHVTPPMSAPKAKTVNPPPRPRRMLRRENQNGNERQNREYAWHLQGSKLAQHNEDLSRRGHALAPGRCGAHPARVGAPVRKSQSKAGAPYLNPNSNQVRREPLRPWPAFQSSGNKHISQQCRKGMARQLQTERSRREEDVGSRRRHWWQSDRLA